ncbi:Uncharacterised protein [Legionella sainthelensi]|nr:Uncharacterised protein [Legionella sainthelensi]
MTPSESAELNIVQDLSQRIVDAQRKIRILDSIKWDDSIKKNFLNTKVKSFLR